MSSKRRLRRKSCEGKRKFANENEAFACLRIFPLDMLSSRRCGVYRCDFCSAFHIGHQSHPTNPHKERRRRSKQGEFAPGPKWIGSVRRPG